jgi:flagellar FliL protein
MAKAAVVNDEDLDLDTDKQAPPKKGSLKKIILWAALGLLLLGGTGAGALFLTGNGEKLTSWLSGAEASESEEASPSGKDTKGKKTGKKKEAPAPAQYYAFDPPFVVNFADETQMRFLQVSMEVMTRDPMVIEAVKTHSPAIRNGILLLLSGQTYDDLISREGKEKIRADSLAEIRKALKEQTGKDGVEAVYFTGFVMQ